MTVAEAFAAERERLLALPEAPLPTDELRAVSAGKTPYVRFDLNDYSIPHPHVRRILDGQDVIANHARSYDRRQQIECAAHLEALVAHKHAASAHRATDRLTAAVPVCQRLLAQAAERGEPLGRTTCALTDLLDRYGASELAAAVDEAPPPLGVPLPAHLKTRDVTVRAHPLAGYDRLLEDDHGDA